MNVRSNYYALFLYSLGLLIAISFVTKHSNASKTSHYGFMIASTLSTRENITKNIWVIDIPITLREERQNLIPKHDLMITDPHMYSDVITRAIGRPFLKYEI